MYADEFKASEGVVDPIAQRNIFSTNPTTEGTNYARNFFCEAICTFVFISAILAAASRAGENVLMLAICVALIVWAVGMGMGGITGFAMNQARDLGPRMAYQVLPIKNKADNNWKYGLLVPGIAPFVGASCGRAVCAWFLGHVLVKGRLYKVRGSVGVNFPTRPRTCKKARCALRAASLFASCGVRWKVNPYRALGILGCVRTSNPTYISEFGCGGRLAVGCFEMQAVLWEGATPWDGMGRLVEEGFYG